MPNQTTSAQPMGPQDLLALSREKWLWMAERNVERLQDLFLDQAKFVHMGATLDKTQELDVIRGGDIKYKEARIEEASVEIIGDTAILLNQLQLVAVVRQTEVTNPFVVTEVYVKQGAGWKLGSMSFTRLLGG